MRALVDAAERAASDPDPRTIDDDRSALFEELVETKKEQGDEAGARAMARTWASFLEKAAARATTKEARAVFDPHRLSGLSRSGRAERAIPMHHGEPSTRSRTTTPAGAPRSGVLDDEASRRRACRHRSRGARVYGPRSLRIFGLAAETRQGHARTSPASAPRLEQALSRTAHAVLNENQKKLRADLADRLASSGSEALYLAEDVPTFPSAAPRWSARIRDRPKLRAAGRLPTVVMSRPPSRGGRWNAWTAKERRSPAVARFVLCASVL